jgi:hypothetical protein
MRCVPEGAREMNEIKVMSLMEAIRKRPKMYLGETSISRFQCYLLGIQHAEHEHHIPVEKRIVKGLETFNEWQEFESFVRKKIKEKRKNIRTFDFALEKCNNDEKEAFYLWFEWYEEWINTKKHVGAAL